MKFSIKLQTLFFTCLFLQAGNMFASEPELKLWYDQPAKNWNEALPIGNGRLAGMVFSEPGKEQIQLNEATIWSGAPSRNDNPAALGVLKSVRDHLFAGRFAQAQELCWNNMIAPNNRYCAKYQTLGNLMLTFGGHAGYSDFYRELDLERAVVTSTYRYNDINYKREVFATKPDDAIVIRLTADKPEAISFQAAVNSPLHQSTLVEGNRLILNGCSGDYADIKGQVLFTGIISIDPTGGNISTTKNTIRVNSADEVIIRITAATNFESYQKLSGNPTEIAKQNISKVEARAYNDLLSDHVKEYQHYFKRVELNVGSTQAQNLPTEQRVKYFNRAYDPALIALYYQFGRYLLISCSQPGGQPANLQGIWNDQTNPAWGSKYTININTEMNYWPAETANLSEMHEPLIQMVKELSESGQQTASSMYGCRGWVTHHNTDIWRSSGAVDGAFWGMWPMGGAWLTQHLWERYLYNGDLEYLRSVYPAMKGASEFYLDFMVPDPKSGMLVVAPSISPENAPSIRPDHSVFFGNTMDNQIIHDLYSKTIMAAELLHEDDLLIAQLKSARNKLLPMQIGRLTQLQEWIEDLDSPTDDHRHVSHLYGVFPAGQISPFRTPQLLEAARNSLSYRGDISTGWSMGWKVNLWARFLDGNRALKLIRDQLTLVDANSSTGGTYPNLFDAHPPFQIDGNFGCVSGINEMLLQSYDGAIHLLPALPDTWSTGRFKGFRTRGGFEIEAEWKEGKLTRLVIHSAQGGNCRIRVPNTMAFKAGGSLLPAQGTNPNRFFYQPELKTPIISSEAKFEGLDFSEGLLFDFDTEAGKTYELTAAIVPELESASLFAPTELTLKFNQEITYQDRYTGFMITVDPNQDLQSFRILSNQTDKTALDVLLSAPMRPDSKLQLAYSGGNVNSIYDIPLAPFSTVAIENHLTGAPLRLKSAQVNHLGDTLRLLFNKSLAKEGVRPGDFILKRSDTTSDREISLTGAIVPDDTTSMAYLFPSETVYAEDVLSLSYTGGAVMGEDGGKLDLFDQFTIFNGARGKSPELLDSGILSENFRIFLVFTKPMQEAYRCKDLFRVDVNGKNEPVRDIWRNEDTLFIETSRILHDIDRILVSYHGEHVKAQDNGLLLPFDDYPVKNTLENVAYASLPGRIQAEEYYTQSGIQVEPSQDTDGSANVGWIHDGDWLEYAVDVPQTGMYKIKFRVASPDGGSIVDIKRENELLLTAALGKTNSWQYYESFDFEINLEAGKQYLTFLVRKSGFNFNWFEISLPEGNSLNSHAIEKIELSPNPNEGIFDVASPKSFTELRIYDVSGRCQFYQIFNTETKVARVVSGLSSGIYQLQLFDHNVRQSETRIVVK